MCVLVLVLLLAASCAHAQPKLTVDETVYLSALAADTWRSLAYMADGKSPLPEDNTDLAGYTSVSNIGFYLACIPGAEKLGLIDHAEATRRVSRVVDACAQLDTWEGFPHSWLRTTDLKPTDERIISSVDLGNYEAGLIVCRQAYPELAAPISKLVEAMNWKALYCPDNGFLYGGWNTRDKTYTKWYYNLYAADSRTASLVAVAHGVPATHWERLERNLEAGAGPTHYAPGWQGGGLFMQTMTALFLDEAATPSGRSATNFAWAQVLRGRDKNLPAWGWSACVTPDGKDYLGWGKYREEVVTPHAAALAMLYLPHEAIADLRAMERLGARQEVTIGGQPRQWGFRDCLDMTTHQSPAKMLILDQGMLFLACANVLAEGCVRDWFARDPLVQAGLGKVTEYRTTAEARATFWQQVEDLRQGRLKELSLH